MLKRTLAGVFMGGFLFLIIWLVGLNSYTPIIFYVLLLALGAIAAHEMYGAVRSADVYFKGGRKGYRVSVLSILVMFAAACPLCYLYGYTGLLFSLLGSFIVAFCVFIFNAKRTFADFSVNIFTLIYPSSIFGLAFVMSKLYGMIPILTAVAVSTISDAAAYFSGSFFGKKKIFPSISPKKTYAGCIGGISGGAVGGILVYLIFELGRFPTYIEFTFSAISSLPALWYALIGFALAFFSETGDLAASRVKREVGIKDYGKILGSHGGLLDRIDSILFTVVCMAAIMEIIRVSVLT